MEITQAGKEYIHNHNVQSAGAHLETLMSEKNLPEASREHLRDVFRGASFIAGMKQACNVQKRLGAPRLLKRVKQSDNARHDTLLLARWVGCRGLLFLSSDRSPSAIFRRASC